MKKIWILIIVAVLILIIAAISPFVAKNVLQSSTEDLQQRALQEGEEKQVTNLVEIISIEAYVNKSDDSLNNFEAVLRLDAGTDPLKMKNFNLSFTGPNQHANGELAHPSLNDPDFEVSSGMDPFIQNVSVTGDEIDNTSTKEILDLDGDTIPEEVFMNTSKGEDHLIINFSKHNEGYARVGLEEDLSNFSKEFIYVLEDKPIYNQDLKNYGFINILANITENSTIPLNGSNDMQISSHYLHECTFDSIPYEENFCFEVMHGDRDTVLGDGEVFKIKFKLKPSNRLKTGEEFKFIFSADIGETRAGARAPDTIEKSKVQLWPVVN